MTDSTIARPTWRQVAIPTEHGGWGLTVEPGLLGLLVAPSWAGACLAVATVLAFLMRTPLKLALVDRRRGRRLPRTHLAYRVVAAEGVLLVVLVVLVAALAERSSWWVPLAVAAPLVAIEFWYDVRSRSRRLVPEIAGSIAVASVASAIALAGGEPAALAIALWVVLAARIVTSIPHVRSQIARLHGRRPDVRPTRFGDAGACGLAIVAVTVEPSVAAGALAVVAVVVLQFVRRHRALAPIKVIGVLQMLLGLAIVLATAIGVAIA